MFNIYSNETVYLNRILNPCGTLICPRPVFLSRAAVYLQGFSVARSKSVESDLSARIPCRHIRLADVEKMQVGRKVVKQTDLHVYFTNLWRKISEETPGIVPDREQAELISNGNCNHPYFAEMTMFPSENALRITCCNYLLGSHSGPFVYDESIPEMEWQLLDGADSVAGYACKIAQTHFRGRVWKAWYTLQIPIPTGPWKLHGLPGIILRAVDQTGTYSFECIGIETDPQSIYEYVPMRSTAVTRTQYLRYERRYHEDPQSVRGDAADIFKLGQDGVTNIETDWQIPYYPIEFE